MRLESNEPGAPVRFGEIKRFRGTAWRLSTIGGAIHWLLGSGSLGEFGPAVADHYHVMFAGERL